MYLICLSQINAKIQKPSDYATLIGLAKCNPTNLVQVALMVALEILECKQAYYNLHTVEAKCNIIKYAIAMSCRWTILLCYRIMQLEIATKIACMST